MKKIFIFTFLIVTGAFANSWNTWQGFQPFRNNAIARLNTESLPQASSIVFSADLTDSLTPEIGTAGTFTRASAGTYFDASGGLASASSGSARFGYPDPTFVTDSTKSVKGLVVENKITNLCLQSEAPATAPWAEVGTPSSVSNSDGTWFNGTMAYGTITTDASNEGISQDTGVSTASLANQMIYSFYAQTASGSQAITLQISGSGATPQTSTKAGTVTTTRQRFYIYKKFTTAVTGDLQIQVTLDTSGSIRIGGFQLEYQYNANTPGYENRANSPGFYVATTTASVSQERDVPLFTGTEISSTLASSTTSSYSIWWWTPWNTDTVNDANYDPISFNSNQSVQDPALELSVTGAWIYVNSSAHDKYNTYTIGDAEPDPSQFTHYVVTQNFSNNTYKLYKNGSLLTPTVENADDPTAHVMVAIGFQRNSATSGISAHGIVNRVRAWTAELDATEAAEVYNLEKGNYGL